MINKDLEKKLWLILESVVGDTIFHRPLAMLVRVAENAEKNNNKD